VSGSSAAATLVLPLSAVRSRRRGAAQPVAPAAVTAPGIAATPIDSASIWWSVRPSPPPPPQRPSTPPQRPSTPPQRPSTPPQRPSTPPGTPPGSLPTAPPSPWSWRLPRPPRLGLVIFLLVASLLGGLLAPACWIVASTELDGIQHGRVEDHHRGLLALARLWGVFASCLLAVLAFYMFFVIARASAHGH
jgi:hypothetical protein